MFFLNSVEGIWSYRGYLKGRGPKSLHKFPQQGDQDSESASLRAPVTSGVGILTLPLVDARRLVVLVSIDGIKDQCWARIALVPCSYWLSQEWNQTKVFCELFRLRFIYLEPEKIQSLVAEVKCNTSEVEELIFLPTGKRQSATE